jgi:hypothetical protein
MFHHRGVHLLGVVWRLCAITMQLGSGVRMITFVNTVAISENRCVNR